jgi:hypothetical protein
MDVLNNAFKGTDISFNLAGTEYITNVQWFETISPNTSAEKRMKTKHNRGDGVSVNIYTVGFEHITYSDPTIMGYAKFPVEFHDNPADDGILILHNAITGGTRPGYSEGKVLVHEMGHWAGLLHVTDINGVKSFLNKVNRKLISFEDCKGKGDYVSDTPPQAKPSYDCKMKNSCKNSPGLDSIRTSLDPNFFCGYGYLYL